MASTKKASSSGVAKIWNLRQRAQLGKSYFYYYCIYCREFRPAATLSSLWSYLFKPYWYGVGWNIENRTGDISKSVWATRESNEVVWESQSCHTIVVCHLRHAEACAVWRGSRCRRMLENTKGIITNKACIEITTEPSARWGGGRKFLWKQVGHNS